MVLNLLRVTLSSETGGEGGLRSCPWLVSGALFCDVPSSPHVESRRPTWRAAVEARSEPPKWCEGLSTVAVVALTPNCGNDGALPPPQILSNLGDVQYLFIDVAIIMSLAFTSKSQGSPDLVPVWGLVGSAGGHTRTLLRKARKEAAHVAQQSWHKPAEKNALSVALAHPV